MSWIGKILFGGVGMLAGGPIGMVLGGALGHLFLDKKVEAAMEEMRKQPGGIPNPFTNNEKKQAAFFASVFGMLGKMAKADGVVSPQEISLVDSLMKNHLKLDQQARRLAVNIFNRAKDDPYPFSQYAQEFYRYFRNEPNMCLFLFDMLYQVAAVDGQLHPAEEQLLNEAADHLNIPHQHYQNFQKRTTPNANPAYVVLGVTQDASESEVKKAYREKVKEFHPDKIVSKGLPEEFLDFAEEKFKEVNEAYETIKKVRGW